MRRIPIHNPADPRIDAFRNVQDVDLKGREGLFMAEGELVIRRLIARAPELVRAVLLAEGRLQSLEVALGLLPAGTPVYVAPKAVLNEIAGFNIHRGALALGVRWPVPGVVDLLRGLGTGRRTVVLIEDLANHDNIGSVFRNAACFGVDAALLTRRCCDPLYRKAIRVSMGAVISLPWARVESAGEGVEALRGAGFPTWALTPAADATPLREALLGGRPERLALLLGAEGPGLTTIAMAAADRRVRIPMAPGADSLNVATACGVALYEAMRA